MKKKCVITALILSQNGQKFTILFYGNHAKMTIIEVNFERRDIYELLADPIMAESSYNVIILQYMIAGHIYDDRAEKIDSLFDEIIDKLIVRKTCDSPLLLIINDIDHKSWICDYFNLFTKKLRKRGIEFKADKRHFEPRENGENAGSKLYKSRTKM